MSIKFNINRPPVSDDEIKQHQNFDNLLKQFKNERDQRNQAVY